MNKNKLLVTIIAIALTVSNAWGQESIAEKMLNQEGMINVEAGKPNSFIFTDLGAWHGYGITKKENKNISISFRGPIFLVDGGYFYGPIDTTGLIKLSVHQKDNVLNFERIKAEHTPGMLMQVFESDKLKISQRLVYISSSQSLTETTIENTGDKKQSIDLKWDVTPYKTEKEAVKIIGNSLAMNTSPHGAYGLTFNNPKIKIKSDELGKGQANLNKLKLKSGEKKVVYFVETFLSDEKIESERFLNILQSPTSKESELNSQLIAKNRKRWLGYLESISETKTKWLDEEYNQRVAVKALQTLVTNWRSAAQNLKGDGVYPNVGYFNGYWAWDSWKHAAAIIDIAPELAKEQIKSMFMFQNEAGMVGDVVRYYKKNDNWRCSKPPLAGWAVWLTYEATKDMEFLKEIYPKLVKYHQWWYKERDANQNGLCEYGSTDGTHQASAWESGMDNAARFNDTKVVKLSYGGTYDQESVDLNSYLWQEKGFLAKMAEALEMHDEADKFENDAKRLKSQITNRFWDETDGYFYDWSLRDNKMLKMAGPEGWTPLFVNLASSEQARRVKDIMLNPEMFNTHVPLGTLAKNHPMYETDGYWRGPIWLDQVYFGIKALRNYGYQKEADVLQKKTLKNLEGIDVPGVPIRENYDPLTGEGIRSIHFSWSSGHLLMMLMEEK